MLLVVLAPTERPVAGYVSGLLPPRVPLVNVANGGFLPRPASDHAARARGCQAPPAARRVVAIKPGTLMRSYSEILAIAADRKGGEAAVLADIPKPLSADALAALPDSDWLAAMARGILQAGISWKVVDNKWPGILEAFHGFDIAAVTFQSEDWFYDLCEDTRVIRSPPKLRAILDNAAFIRRISDEHGSFGRKIGDWPSDDFAGLLRWLQDEGSRLGGATGAYMLRKMGKDSFVLSQDVVGRLIAEGVIDKAPTSKTAMAAVQAAFNDWRAESGQPLTTISRVLAQSVG
jgi:3-methyladenine DNA glycosylase Tag